MREIKFRAWTGKDMILNDSLFEFQKQNLTKDEFDKFVFLQNTGLKDKNGIEIYEGDVVDGQDFGNFPSRFGVVRWIDAGFRFSWLMDRGRNFEKVPFYEDEHYWNALGENTKILEVIGNIYENPELIKNSNNK